MESIQNSEEKIRARKEEVKKAHSEERWLIWSFEHNAWWMPRQCGYTGKIKHAGMYKYDQAVEIVEGANKYCKKKPNEAMLPDFRITQTFKIGDRVLIEEAWEDDRGFFHDAIGIIEKLSDPHGREGYAGIDFSPEPVETRELISEDNPFELSDISKL